MKKEKKVKKVKGSKKAIKKNIEKVIAKNKNIEKSGNTKVISITPNEKLTAKTKKDFIDIAFIDKGELKITRKAFDRQGKYGFVKTPIGIVKFNINSDGSFSFDSFAKSFENKPLKITITGKETKEEISKIVEGIYAKCNINIKDVIVATSEEAPVKNKNKVATPKPNPKVITKGETEDEDWDEIDNENEVPAKPNNDKASNDDDTEEDEWDI